MRSKTILLEVDGRVQPIEITHYLSMKNVPAETFRQIIYMLYERMKGQTLQAKCKGPTL